MTPFYLNVVLYVSEFDPFGLSWPLLLSLVFVVVVVVVVVVFRTLGWVVRRTFLYRCSNVLIVCVGCSQSQV